MCSPWYGNFCASDWNDLPARREFDGKFLENVKTSPHAKEKNTDHLLAAVSTEGKSIHLVFQAELRRYGRMTRCKSCISTLLQNLKFP